MLSNLLIRNNPKDKGPDNKEIDDLPVVITRNKRAKRLALRLDSQRRHFRLVVPSGVSLGYAKRFARKHEDWMQEQLSGIPQPVFLTHGTKIPLLGRDRTIYVLRDSQFKRTKIDLTDNKLLISTNKDDPSGRLLRFLKNLAREELSKQAQRKAADIGKTIESVQVRDTKSRWGSCSSDGRLSFSWRLILAPPSAMDYVVAHEVAHLNHLNHSKAFWSLCRSLSDDFIEGEHWMRNHGHELMRYCT